MGWGSHDLPRFHELLIWGIFKANNLLDLSNYQREIDLLDYYVNY